MLKLLGIPSLSFLKIILNITSTLERTRFLRGDRMDPKYNPSKIRHERMKQNGELTFSDAQV